jgi:hypothetical protein
MAFWPPGWRTARWRYHRGGGSGPAGRRRAVAGAAAVPRRARLQLSDALGLPLDRLRPAPQRVASRPPAPVCGPSRRIARQRHRASVGAPQPRSKATRSAMLWEIDVNRDLEPARGGALTWVINEVDTCLNGCPMCRNAVRIRFGLRVRDERESIPLLDVRSVVGCSPNSRIRSALIPHSHNQ